MKHQLLEVTNCVNNINAIKAQSIKGQQFINESTQILKSNPFSYTLHNNILQQAANVNDNSVNNWAKSQLEFIDENFTTYALNMLCESTKYDGTAFAGFKSIANDLLKLDEQDIVRQIAIDNAFNSFSMLPEVRQLIQRAKNVYVARTAGAIASNTGAVNKFVKNDIGLIKQIAASTFVIGIRTNAIIILNSATNKVSIGNYNTIMPEVDSELGFEYNHNEFVALVDVLKRFEAFYDQELMSFNVTMLGSKVSWRTADNELFLDGQSTTLAKINQMIQIKAQSLQNSAYGKNATDLEFANARLTELNALYQNKDYIAKLNAIITVQNNDSTVFVLCDDSTNVNGNPYTYSNFVIYPNSVAPFYAEFNSFNDFAKQFVNRDVVDSLRTIFANEIKVENDVAKAVFENAQKINANIAKLEQQKEELVSIKAKASDADLNDLNAKILTIDDIIARNKSLL